MMLTRHGRMCKTLCEVQVRLSCMTVPAFYFVLVLWGIVEGLPVTLLCVCMLGGESVMIGARKSAACCGKHL